MITELSGPGFALYVVAIVIVLIPLTIWAFADLLRQREMRLAAQRRIVRR